MKDIAVLRTEQKLRAKLGRLWLGDARCLARAADVGFGEGCDYRSAELYNHADAITHGDLERAFWPTRKTEYT